jgi:hypothetical protein
MYDANFTHARATRPPIDRTAAWVLRIAATAVIVLSASANAQMPGAPVLQNAWATPGLVGAVDLSGGSDGSTYAAAVGWTPGSGRFQLSGGFGAQTRTGLGSRSVYGVRAAIPFGGPSSTFGFAAFAGIGGSSGAKKTTNPVAGTAVVDVPSTTQIPLGAAIGWRKAIGSNHGLSVYGTPSYVLFSGGSKSGGLFRASIGADAGITSSIGATLGIEFGGTRPRAVGGPSGTLYGLGISYAFGRR